MEKQAKPLTTSDNAANSDFDDELIRRVLDDAKDISQRFPNADKEPETAYAARVLKELQEDMQAMLNDTWSDDNERTEKLLPALDEEEDDLLSDEWDTKLVERLLAELDNYELE
ncbi:MAG TPA: hypothetical protein VEG44_07390 [Candidatus Acidoferrales bacterium]|nr:hypothetical protein [Candidatus Acidoferrales bacterium]